MSTDITALLAEGERLEQERTNRGPWKWGWRRDDEQAPGSVFAEPRDGHAYAVAMCPRYGREQFESNAAFIAFWGTHAPAILARVRELEADLIAAAGDLPVPVPEPGTNMARLLIANRLLKAHRDRLTTEVAYWKAAHLELAERLEKAGADVERLNGIVAEVGIALTGVEIVPSHPVVASVQRTVERRGDGWEAAAKAEAELEAQR